jgi:DNA-binding response OmpR family regulator
MSISSSSTSFPPNITPKSATVLVVDDDRTFVSIVARRLQGDGYNTILASNGIEALSILNRQSIDLVLLDIMMADMNGLETLQAIRANYSMLQLPVIMVTARDGSADMVEAFELGANDYVTKPIDLPVIMARVKSHLRTKYADRSPLSFSPPPTSHSLTVTLPTGKVEDKLLLGRYQIVQELARNALKVIYLARDTQQSGQPLCSIEQIDASSEGEEISTAISYQWATEVKTFQKIDNPNIAKISKSLKNKRFFYLIYEHVEGIRLLDKIRSERTLSLIDVLSLMLEMLEILKTLHQQQLIHQHLQANSFLYHPHQHLMLVDLGIANRLAASLDPTAIENANIYHPYPQQGNHLSINSDIYAVATITLQALTGISPDRLEIDPDSGELCWRHLRTVPETFANILDKMLAKTPADSYYNIDSILQDLRQLPIVCTLFC